MMYSFRCCCSPARYSPIFDVVGPLLSSLAVYSTRMSIMRTICSIYLRYRCCKTCTTCTLNASLVSLVFHAQFKPSFTSPLSPSITPSLFHSKLKTYLFSKSFPPQISRRRHALRTEFLGKRDPFPLLQRLQSRAICYDKSVRLSVRPSHSSTVSK